MSRVEIGLLLAWAVAGLCLTGLYLNDIRRVYNNFVPGALQAASITRLGSDLGWHFRFYRIDPALLTEKGRLYRERAVRRERLIYVWLVVGFIAIAGYFSLIRPS